MNMEPRHELKGPGPPQGVQLALPSSGPPRLFATASTSRCKTCGNVWRGGVAVRAVVRLACEVTLHQPPSFPLPFGQTNAGSQILTRIITTKSSFYITFFISLTHLKVSSPTSPVYQQPYFPIPALSFSRTLPQPAPACPTSPFSPAVLGNLSPPR
ncbi:hypothetical protein E2C01_064771 [Portunus trituberculatus]|uniref:Uncharacterized protein n=1 Tax=Portunus trituberculatus TaxID=210409 RepID=A0A5B7HCQ0_PORTR|nr:hypothetical protein [Portunus trituberculatus]